MLAQKIREKRRQYFLIEKRLVIFISTTKLIKYSFVGRGFIKNKKPVN